MKKKNAGIIASLIALKSKVFAVPQILYGPPSMGPSILELVLRGVQAIIAPILFLIGIIIYLKKSKVSKRRKAIVTIILILLLVGIYCGIELFLIAQYGLAL